MERYGFRRDKLRPTEQYLAMLASLNAVAKSGAELFKRRQGVLTEEDARRAFHEIEDVKRAVRNVYADIERELRACERPSTSK